MTSSKTVAAMTRLARMRDFMRRKSQEFAKILAGDAGIAREQLRKRITKLLLTPEQSSEGFVFEATGDVSLFQGAGDVMLTNSLEGFEPSTFGYETYVLTTEQVVGFVLSTSAATNTSFSQ
jgi:hypothetical protein